MFRKLFSGLMIGMLSVICQAQTYNPAPSDGLWWNPAQSGIGWTMETENNITVITHYAFTPMGASTFFLTAGVYNGFTRTIEGAWEGYSGGQCIGCPHTPSVGTNLGPIRVVFTSDTNGTIFYPNGTSIPIQKLRFVYADPKAYLRGEWAIAEAGIISSAFFIRLTDDCATCTQPTNIVQGQTILSSPGRGAGGFIVPGSNQVFAILLDSSTSFFHYYFILGESNSWTGVGCVRLKTDPPPTSPTQCASFLVFSSRTKTMAAVQANNTLSDPKAVRDAGHQESVDMMNYSAGKSGSAVQVPEWAKNVRVSWDSLRSTVLHQLSTAPE